MSTTAQFAANQANAQHSTGPITPEGKATSARNNLRHGFRSATVLLPGDDPAEYEDLLTELSEHFDPADLTETRLIREMADAEWRLRRVRAHMESALSRHMETLSQQNPALAPLDLQSLAVETLHLTGCSYGTWLRYETKFERQYQRANATWTRYQDSRRRSSKQDADIAMKQALSVSLRPLASTGAPSRATHSPGEMASNVQNASPQHVPAETAAPQAVHNAESHQNSTGLRTAA